MSILKIFDMEFSEWKESKYPNSVGWIDRVLIVDPIEDPKLDYLDYCFGYLFHHEDQMWEVYFSNSLSKKEIIRKNLFELNELIQGISQNENKKVEDIIDQYLIRLSNLSLFL